MTLEAAKIEAAKIVTNAGFKVGSVDYNEVADVVTVDSREVYQGRSLYGSAFFSQARRVNGTWKFYANNRPV